VVVSLDGGKTFQPAPSGVVVVYKDVRVDGEDRPGELSFKATREGLSTDVWVTREEPLDHNIGAEIVPIERIISRLVCGND
jgi:hypothetical protein